MTSLEHTDTPAIEKQEPTREGLKEVIADLPLVRDPNLIRNDSCNRCERKNNIRRNYDLPQRDPMFDDEERVTLVCAYDNEPDQTRGWVIRAAHHADHPTKNKDDVAVPGHAIAEVTATLERTDWTYPPIEFPDGSESEGNYVEDISVVRDVKIEWFSPVDEGQEREPAHETDDNGMARPKATDPIPDWPDEENEWRKEIIQKLGE